MGTLRILGTAAAIVGAAVSLALLFIASSHTPLVLLVTFIGWVVLPFVLLAAGIVSNFFSDLIHPSFAVMSILISVSSIAVYTYFTLSPPATTPARTWLLTPGISLILILTVFFYVKFRSSGRR